MGSRVRVFLNARSGSGQAGPEEIAAMFRECGCECAVTDVSRDCDVAGLARSEPPEVAFIAAGGDGTVNAVASAVAGTERRMGVLPVGTLNHFAKDLGLPLELKDAVKIAAGEEVRRVDAAEVNGSVFVNNSSLGFYPGMVIERERLKKGGWNKWASLVVASARGLARFRCLTAEIEVDGQIRRCRTPFLFVGNNVYCMEGLQLGKRERLDGGELSLYLAPGAGRFTLLRLAVGALFGGMRQHACFEEFRVQRFTVNVRARRMRVSLDGELRRMAGPLTYSIQRQALFVLCPPVAEEQA